MLTVLPDPDSPMTPSTSPPRMSRSMPRTASTSPSLTRKLTRRSRISTSGGPGVTSQAFRAGADR